MAGARAVEDIEPVLEEMKSGGRGKPPGNDDFGGDDGGDPHDDSREPGPPSGEPSPRRYATAVAIASISILVLFMAMAAAFLVLRATSPRWVAFHVPSIVWANTAVLVLSSLTVELAQRRLARDDRAGFYQLWIITTGLGVLFLCGQLVAWRRLVEAGIYVATTQASSFFYVLTALHGVHLLGGVIALVYVAFRNFGEGRVSRAIAAEVASYYWHFMDGLWLFLLMLLYFGK